MISLVRDILIVEGYILPLFLKFYKLYWFALGSFIVSIISIILILLYVRVKKKNFEKHLNAMQGDRNNIKTLKLFGCRFEYSNHLEDSEAAEDCANELRGIIQLSSFKGLLTVISVCLQINNIISIVVNSSAHTYIISYILTIAVTIISKNLDIRLQKYKTTAFKNILCTKYTKSLEYKSELVAKCGYTLCTRYNGDLIVRFGESEILVNLANT